jgi:hypothetical protein
VNPARRAGGRAEDDVAPSRPRLAWVAPAGLARPRSPRRGPAVRLSIVGGSLASRAATAPGGAPLRDAAPLIDWFGEGR